MGKKKMLMGGSVSKSGFISTWKTDNISTGSSADNQVSLPLVSNGIYDFSVDWGDGNIDTILVFDQAETTHTYGTIGTYEIKIKGTIQGWAFDGTLDRLKILEVLQWDNFQPTGEGVFYGCSNLILDTVSDVLDLSLSTIMKEYFRGCSSLTTINNAEYWDTSNITSFANTFNGCSNFNQNINSWDTGNITALSSVFNSCEVFNQPLGNWDVSKVTVFSRVFYGCKEFNQNINSWNVSLSTNFSDMFYNGNNFNQPLDDWDTSNATIMEGMFQNCGVFDQNINSWDVSKNTDFSTMFSGCNAFNQPLTNWVTSLVENMDSMFERAFAFNQDIGMWNVSNVTNFTEFMRLKVGISFDAANLDAIYNGWSLQTLHPNINIDFGTIKYTAAGQAGKDILEGAPNNWIITDGGI